MQRVINTIELFSGGWMGFSPGLRDYYVQSNNFFTSNNKKDRNVGLRRTLVEVDGSDNDHAQRDDDCDPASDCASDRPKKKEKQLDEEVYKVAGRFVSITYPTEQGVV